MICAEPLVRLLEHMLPAVYYMSFHQFVIAKPCEEFRCDEKVLTCVFVASDFNHTFMNHTLVSRIHALVDLVDDAEWRLRKRLERHQIKYSGDRSLTTGLTVLVENLETFALPITVLLACFSPICCRVQHT